MKMRPKIRFFLSHLFILGPKQALKMLVDHVIFHLHKNDVTMAEKIGDTVFLTQHA